MFRWISFLVQGFGDRHLEDAYEKVELLFLFFTQSWWAHSAFWRPPDCSYSIQCSPTTGRCSCDLCSRKSYDWQCKLSAYPFQLYIIWKHMQRVSIGTDSLCFILHRLTSFATYVHNRYPNQELAHLSQQLPSEFKVRNISLHLILWIWKLIFFFCRYQWARLKSGSWNMNSIQLILKHIKASHHF